MRSCLIAVASLFFSSTASIGARDTPIILNELRPQSWDYWSEIAGLDFAKIKDDDIQRHAADKAYFSGIQIDEWYIRENGFVWHMLRYTNIAEPVGPLWIVPHDDENAAFDAMIAGIKRYGGVGFAVNSGSGSQRKQAGRGTCGGRPAVMEACDPNRNFSDATPLFTNAILSGHQAGQPVIALHTNTPGFGKGRGSITILDVAASRIGKHKARENGYFGNASVPELNDADVYAILPFAATKVTTANAIACRRGLNAAGVNVWHEKVAGSDGSLSNYVALQRPDIAYVNMEAKRETDISKAARAHGMMTAAYLLHCNSSGNDPAAIP